MRASWVLWGFAGAFLSAGLHAQAQQQDPRAQAIVRTAVQTELDADRADQSRWEYLDLIRRPDGEALYLVIETGHGSVRKKLQQNGRHLSDDELRAEDERIRSFVNDPRQQEKQRKDGEQDDKRAANMLRLLPDAFLWSVRGEDHDMIILAFTPNPRFSPPDMESRVFAAMEGEIVVHKTQNRIVTIKGRLIRDVKFGFGLLGRMNAGGTFNVERREIAPGIWQITESHVHITGRALLFKTIGEEEDEVKTQFLPTPATSLQKAADLLKEVKGIPPPPPQQQEAAPPHKKIRVSTRH
ncbi:MAG: hypothetical protein FWD64_03865 [Acidobacteriaceae bacterium]|nr:hypothetical protein [Acidobacteriaceae bacterium]